MFPSQESRREKKREAKMSTSQSYKIDFPGGVVGSPEVMTLVEAMGIAAKRSLYCHTQVIGVYLGDDKVCTKKSSVTWFFRGEEKTV